MLTSPCTRIVVFAVAIVIFGTACKVADQRGATSTTSQNSVVNPGMDELKYSQFCTEAAEKFWNRHEWKDQHEIRQIASYTSHYNKKLNKCLVDVYQIS